MHRVLDIRRYPLKSAGAERLREVELGEHGLAGDRTWVCLDADGTVGSAKQPRLWAGLLTVGARQEAASGRVVIAVPGGTPAFAGSPEADAAVTAFLGRPVRLSRTAPPGASRRHRWPDEPGMIPEWAAGAEPGGEETVALRDGSGDGRFHDFGALHIVTTGTLARLRSEHGAEIDTSRFRPNLVIDLDEDPEPGQRISLGPEAVVEVTVPTPRCVVPSLSHGPVPEDRALMRTLARHHRTEVPGFGRAACFGCYAEVVRPGRIEIDDPVMVLGRE
ncbi:MOSC domain-containing protein [Actinocorallia populi]|uniref:MOSC domain-containing protein n=1 Tax=Actinocorallia populi TaxID=2079200 RepID=UPI000D088FEB|nr:MOSC domain-containing protein [Actinocorallia populi]